MTAIVSASTAIIRSIKTTEGNNVIHNIGRAYCTGSRAVYKAKNSCHFLTLINTVVQTTLIYVYTVEPRFMNLIRSWRPFVNRNVRKPKLS
jgi:hypothetical protein